MICSSKRVNVSLRALSLACPCRLDFVFHCEDKEMTLDAIATIAATLANAGVCPTTDERVFEGEALGDQLPWRLIDWPRRIDLPHSRLSLEPPLYSYL